MPIDKKAALHQIDSALNQYRSVIAKCVAHQFPKGPDAEVSLIAAATCMKAAIDRLAPLASVYRTYQPDNPKEIAGSLRDFVQITKPDTLKRIVNCSTEKPSPISWQWRNTS